MGVKGSKEESAQPATVERVDENFMKKYDKKGRVIEITSNENVIESRKYDDERRIIEIKKNGKVFEVKYDERGEREERERMLRERDIERNEGIELILRKIHEKDNQNQPKSFKLNANDKTLINYAIDTINKNSKDCKLKPVVDKVNNKVYYPDYEKIKHYINFIDDLQSKKLGPKYSDFPIDISYGTFFGQYGLEHDRSDEYAYIIAFLLGCKDFIGTTKCAYSSSSDFLDNVGKSYNWYQVMSIIVNYLNDKNKEEKLLYVASPDPYPDFMNHNKEVCGKKHKNDSPYHPIFSLSGNDANDEKNSHKNSHKHIIITLMATLLFIILSNMLTYGFTNSIFKITINNEGNPSEIGILLHALVFFGLFYICYSLVK